MVGRSFRVLGRDALHSGDNVTKATCPARVADLARTALSRNVSANTLDDSGATALHQLGANVSLVLAEAVAQETFPRGLLVPHGHSEILRPEAVASVGLLQNR
jgi:hypothetical protein